MEIGNNGKSGSASISATSAANGIGKLIEKKLGMPEGISKSAFGREQWKGLEEVGKLLAAEQEGKEFYRGELRALDKYLSGSRREGEWKIPLPLKYAERSEIFSGLAYWSTEQLGSAKKNDAAKSEINEFANAANSLLYSMMIKLGEKGMSNDVRKTIEYAKSNGLLAGDGLAPTDSGMAPLGNGPNNFTSYH